MTATPGRLSPGDGPAAGASPPHSGPAAAAPLADRGEEATPGHEATPPLRLGDPVELPWWVIPLGLPPLLTLLAGLVVAAPLSGRLLDLAASAVMLGLVVGVALRVRSRNLQSVWISAGYGFWLFAVLLWAVEATGPGRGAS
jgi:hypothetical protein